MSDRPFFEKGYVDEGGKVSNTATTNGRTTGDIRAPEKQQPKIGQILSHSEAVSKHRRYEPVGLDGRAAS